MKPNEIKTLFNYNFWAFEHVWECISQITDEQFIEEIDYSTGSIRNLVVHIMSANQNWMSRLQRTEMSSRLVFEQFDTLLKTKPQWDELRNKFLDYTNSLDPDQLEETIGWELPVRGLKLSNARWEILLHMANHETDHRTQILAILHHHFHVKTVEQDMILYLPNKRKYSNRHTNRRLVKLTCPVAYDTLSQQLIVLYSSREAEGPTL